MMSCEKLFKFIEFSFLNVANEKYFIENLISNIELDKIKF